MGVQSLATGCFDGLKVLDVAALVDSLHEGSWVVQDFGFRVLPVAGATQPPLQLILVQYDYLLPKSTY